MKKGKNKMEKKSLIVRISIIVVVGLISLWTAKYVSNDSHNTKPLTSRYFTDTFAENESLLSDTDTSLIARVNNSPITLRLYKRALNDQYKTDTTLNYDSLQKHVLENLIIVELLFQEAQKKGVNLVIGAGAMRVDAIKRSYKSEEKYQEALSNYDMSEEEYVHEWFRQATIDMYITEYIEDSVTVSDKTLEKLYMRLQESAEPLPVTFEKALPGLRKSYIKEKTKLLIEKKIGLLKKKATIEVF